MDTSKFMNYSAVFISHLIPDAIYAVCWKKGAVKRKQRVIVYQSINGKIMAGGQSGDEAI
jgi:hypothetical protein